jgi:aryl-alcohol dehydrogenase-like predicted oxidoreductase
MGRPTGERLHHLDTGQGSTVLPVRFAVALGPDAARVCAKAKKEPAMKMNPLGRTGLTVSELCLGTMTFGTQTSEAEGHAQIDRALAAGINFVDTAEMYPVNPVAKETIGRTEEIIGTWNARSGRRGDYILATKHSGAGLAAVRDGAPISSATIPGTVEGSLRRLQTDYIDLYQLHWPNRGSYMFRQNWDFDPSDQNKVQTIAHMEDTLEALQRQVDKGNIRHFGLSNESAWGTAQWLRLAEDHAWPRVASIQNEYSLLCRLYDTDLAELSVNEDVGLLAFSPLGTGLLSGKYQGGAVPDGSRKSLNPELGGRDVPRVYEAVDAYLNIAQRHGLDPVHMALAWCRTRPFMASAIFGATRMDQLEHALESVDVILSEDALADISAAHRAHPMPY